MSSTEPEPLPKELADTMERIGRSIAAKAERERHQPDPTEPEPKQTAQIVQLPFWPEPTAEASGTRETVQILGVIWSA